MERSSTVSNSRKISAQSLNNEKSIVGDLRRITSNFMCSADITRENLKRRSNISTVINADDDDEVFFEKIKAKIDNDLRMHSKENKKVHLNQSVKIEKKKKIMIDQETENVMKRFKEYIAHTKNTKPLSINHDNVRSDPVASCSCNRNSVLDKSKASPGKQETKNQNVVKIKRTNIFFPNIIMKTNFRAPATKCLLEKTSKLQRNIVPVSAKIGILHEKYEESRCYRLSFRTPPRNSEIKDGDSEQRLSNNQVLKYKVKYI